MNLIRPEAMISPQALHRSLDLTFDFTTSTSHKPSGGAAWAGFTGDAIRAELLEPNWLEPKVATDAYMYIFFLTNQTHTCLFSNSGVVRFASKHYPRGVELPGGWLLVPCACDWLLVPCACDWLPVPCACDWLPVPCACDWLLVPCACDWLPVPSACNWIFVMDMCGRQEPVTVW